jgi:hypothetical protein
MNATSMPATWTLLLYLLTLLATVGGMRSTQALVAAPARVASSPSGGCLPSADGYLRARLRSQQTIDIDWQDMDMQCDGGSRPADIGGVRVTFAGRLPHSGRHLRMIFGIASPADATTAHNIPTNVTLIFEDESKLYATAGDGKCTVDEVSIQSMANVRGSWRRLVARGFCTVPVAAMNGSDALEFDRFDFAGGLRDED